MDEFTRRRLTDSLTTVLISYYKRGVSDAFENLIQSVEEQDEKFVLLEELEAVRAALPLQLDEAIGPMVEQTRIAIQEFFIREEAKKDKGE